MIKANELRIGNSILQDGELVFVTPWRLGLIELDSVVYEPIPLTEEWLLKFGFEVINKSYFELKINSIVLEYTKNLNNECYIMINESIKIYIKHVHQLQNLYFALTGEELTIKENEQYNNQFQCMFWYSPSIRSYKVSNSIF